MNMLKIKKKLYPKLFGKEITKPGFFYSGGALHYLNKEGKMIHDSKIRTQTELNKLVMSKSEFSRRYGPNESKSKANSKKLKKKNPSIKNEIHAIERMKRMLSSWNLKYDVFPDIEEYVRKHWTQTYGKREALDLLNAAMNQRSDLYWDVERLIPPGGTRVGRELEKAEKAWRKVVNRLNGLEEKKEVERTEPTKIKTSNRIDLRTSKDLIPHDYEFDNSGWDL